MTQDSVRKDEILLSSTGRPPWYTPTGKAVPSYVIGIAGGSASGKTHVATSILRQLNHIPTCLILSQDSFYNKLNAEKHALAHKNELDLDAPEAIDMKLFAQCVRDLKEGKAVNCPVYSFSEHQRLEETKYLYGASVIIVEGILTLCSPELRDLYDLKIFVNADSDIMLSRRILRDTRERGRDIEGIISQYLRFVKSSYDTFVLPSSKHADIIVPGQDNDTAKVLLAAHVQREIDARSLRFRSKLMEQNVARSRRSTLEGGAPNGTHETQEPFFTLLTQTNQLQGIMTILRDASTPRSEFIFYVDRLSSLVVEEALAMLEYGPTQVTTPMGGKATGMAMLQKQIVGVCIQRSGGPFVKGLRRVIRDVRIGALLIQSDNRTGEPLLFHTSIPDCVKGDSASETVVFLMDAQISTGAAAIMAIRVMLDHGIQERHIVFLTYLVAPQGLSAVYNAFPGVRIVAAAKGDDIEEWTFSLPSHTDQGSSPVEEDTSSIDLLDKPNHLQEAFKRLQFNRRPSDTPKETKKKAWIVVPDCGAFGDRYLGA